MIRDIHDLIEQLPTWLEQNEGLYRAGVEAADAQRVARVLYPAGERAAFQEIDRVANEPYRRLLEAVREVIAVENELGERLDEDLSHAEFHRRESAWSYLRALAAKGGGGE